MASKGRPTSDLKSPITIIFATSKNSNAQIKVKTVRNRSVDDLIECNYIIPGIPARAIIKEVLVGSNPNFINPYLEKYGLSSSTK
jgi:hypothetical protein